MARRLAKQLGLPHKFSSSREAMAALIAIRAIERARELAAEEKGSVALRRALARAQEPLEEYVATQLRKLARPSTRRRKA
jgi:hypothetical protein